MTAVSKTQVRGRCGRSIQVALHILVLPSSLLLQFDKPIRVICRRFWVETLIPVDPEYWRPQPRALRYMCTVGQCHSLRRENLLGKPLDEDGVTAQALPYYTVTDHETVERGWIVPIIFCCQDRIGFLS